MANTKRTNIHLTSHTPVFARCRLARAWLPGAYSKPFNASFTAQLMPKDDELIEYVCNENNQDVPYLVGPRQ